MNRAGGTAAIILAAGRASRMGSCKPALPLGPTSALQRLVGAALQAGVEDIVVVTGHTPQALSAMLDALPVRSVHNAGYDAGMFSSVLVGVKALPADVRAFFILPADYPLVRSQVFSRLLAAFEEGIGDIVHPTCCGRRGHPPLLSGRYRAALLSSAVEGDLASFLGRHAEDTAEVEVKDLSILMDMDTEDDYRRLCRFAATDTDSSLSRDDALYLLSLLDAPDQVIRHCCAVSAAAQAMARALVPFVPGLDVDLASAAGLLHDMARTSDRHALVGETLLSNLGLHRLAEVVGAHMELPADPLASLELTETHLVYLADKLVDEDQVVGLEQRTAGGLRKAHDRAAGPHEVEGLLARMEAARTIQDRVEAVVGGPLAEVLTRAAP
jgi:molybdenum cofactor cytidylyltransferase